ncbi:MAG: mannose-1-phosphate guanylyltransferase [Parcubacteria group bacterium]|nr:mannose-1-phosphate guanylyltransferase [Parcubacteria group bacterium]
MKFVILAGGTGTRLWPVSRKAKPKQFCSLLSAEPLIIDTYKRLLGRFKKEDIFIAANEKFEPYLRQCFPDFLKEQFILEPVSRDTAPAMGYAALFLFSKYPDEPMAFVPSDHYIGNIPRFLEMLAAAEKMIFKTGKMVDIAVQPNFPSTAVGYTHIGEKLEEADGIGFYKFLGHKEKPPYEAARQYLEDGSYLWHANYYTWTPRKFLEAYRKYAPSLHAALEVIRNQGALAGAYSQMEKISFDYAITEKMNKDDALIIRGDFGWSDIGAWDVLYDQLKAQADDGQNVFKGKVLGLDTHRTLVMGSEDKLIAAIGLHDMAIIETEDALLVCPLSRAQEVKKLVCELEEEYL